MAKKHYLCGQRPPDAIKNHIELYSSLFGMLETLRVAKYIADEYQTLYGQQIDEMKLHKLMYFTQRESIIQTGAHMFDAEFRAWKYGPVLLEVREACKTMSLSSSLQDDEKEPFKAVFKKIMTHYASKKTMSLVCLSHAELSWKRARKGYDKYESSDVPMMLSDIYEDAAIAKRHRQEAKFLRRLQGHIDAHKAVLQHLYTM